jgi:hypothetical protein
VLCVKWVSVMVNPIGEGLWVLDNIVKGSPSGCAYFCISMPNCPSLMEDWVGHFAEQFIGVEVIPVSLGFKFPSQCSGGSVRRGVWVAQFFLGGGILVFFNMNWFPFYWGCMYHGSDNLYQVKTILCWVRDKSGSKIQSTKTLSQATLTSPQFNA